MALISCRECSSQISSLAAACPKCGAPIQRQAPPPLPRSAGKLETTEKPAAPLWLPWAYGAAVLAALIAIWLMVVGWINPLRMFLGVPQE